MLFIVIVVVVVVVVVVVAAGVIFMQFHCLLATVVVIVAWSSEKFTTIEYITMRGLKAYGQALVYCIPSPLPSVIASQS